MKTRGQIVRDWREGKGLTVGELASKVGTSRQNIANLEADAVDQPRYLPKLAEVMGYASTDDLLARQAPPDNPTPRRKSYVGDAMAALLNANNPPAVVKLLAGHLRVHGQARRKSIGRLLADLAENPDDQETADEIAAQLGMPPQQSAAA